MISGELDILKDWCYEAVSTAFIILVKWQSKKKKKVRRAGDASGQTFSSMYVVLGSIPCTAKINK